MPFDWSLLEAIDWSRTFHAYALASDTPVALRALAGEDPAGFDDAMEHLWGSVLHQGTVYPATAPTVRVICGLLAGLDRDRVIELLGFLREAGQSAVTDVRFDGSAGSGSWAGETVPEPSAREVDAVFAALAADDPEAWGSPALDHLWRRGIADLRACGPEAVAAILPWLGDPDPHLRAVAAGAASAWGGVVDEAARSRVAGRLAAIPESAGRDELAARVLALGEVGADVGGWLAQADPAIRACAAMFVDSPAATRELLAALRHPAEADVWFARRPAHFDGHVRFSLLPALLTRGLRFEELLPVALAIAAEAGQWTADLDWGLLLDVAFDPDDPPGGPADLTEAQRQFLAALLANDRLWDPRNGNVRLALKRAGLPELRAGVEALVGRGR